MDAARTARQLGADEALIVYRRDRAHMPAHGFEADEALAEGVKIKWLTTIKEIVAPRLRWRRWSSAPTDSRNRPASSRPCRPTRSCWRSVRRPRAVFCATSRIDFKRDGTVVVGPDMMTGTPGFSPAATWCRESARSPSPSAMASRGAEYRRLAARTALSASRLRSGGLRDVAPAGVQRRRSDAAARAAGADRSGFARCWRADEPEARARRSAA